MYNLQKTSCLWIFHAITYIPKSLHLKKSVWERIDYNNQWVRRIKTQEACNIGSKYIVLKFQAAETYKHFCLQLLLFIIRKDATAL